MSEDKFIFDQRESLEMNQESILRNSRMKIVNIESVDASNIQPRKFFKKEALEELSESIKNNGIIQPIIVYQVSENKYRIISGERRYRGALRANLREIPVIIKDLEQKDIFKLSLLENIQREDLTILEEARSYKYLSEELKSSQEELARILGKTRSYISNVIRLLNLPKKLQEMLERGEISQGHARALIGIDRAEEIALKAKEENLTVRDIEKLIAQMREKKVKIKFESNKSHSKLSKLKNDLSYIANIIGQNIGMKTNIDLTKKGGKISIYFQNAEELERFLLKLEYK